VEPLFELEDGIVLRVLRL